MFARLKHMAGGASSSESLSKPGTDVGSRARVLAGHRHRTHWRLLAYSVMSVSGMMHDR